MPVAGEISCVRRSEGIRRLSLDLDLGTSFFSSYAEKQKQSIPHFRAREQRR